MIDTGATSSAIHLSLADDLGLRQVGQEFGDDSCLKVTAGNQIVTCLRAGLVRCRIVLRHTRTRAIGTE